MSSLDSSIQPDSHAPIAISDLSWYAVHARVHHERRVFDALQIRDVESFYPSFLSKRRWRNGTEPILEMPLLPGYLFVRIAKNERLKVMEVPGVVNIVGNGSLMVPIAAQEVERFRKGCDLGVMQPHPLLAVGEKARIVSGPFSGSTGVITQHRGALRIILSVAFAPRAVAVEVDAADLEPLRLSSLH